MSQAHNLHILGELGNAGQHGVAILNAARGAGDIYVGAAGQPLADDLIRDLGLRFKGESEAFVIANTAEGWFIAGSDDTGVMYGCQEAADQLAAFGELRAVSRAPFVKVRGLYDFLHNEDNERDWFYSKEYWIDYFDTMAANRYNSFNLVFSHQTYYLAPMFTYFLEVPELPEIRALDADAETVAKNREMLKFISAQAESRGIDFILGMWQMCSWKGNENDWRPLQEGMVRGITAENHRDYIYLGMKKLIEQFPAIKGLQIRANEESGIPRSMQTEFFKHSLFKAMGEADRPFIFDFRLWLAERETVDTALEMVPGTRWSCKYWGEFMGAPYQPAKISPGYSYSDFLRQPLPVDFIYQVWSLGSPRLLLWGDPEYVRRFVRTTTLGGGCGFEINLPLAQKGYGNEPGAWRIFKNPEDEYYTHEIERYWLFNRLFGRLGYDPDAASGEWMPLLRARFGDDAQKVMDAYNTSGRIITFLVQYTLSDPNMYIWPEIDTGGMLDFYIQTPSSDRCTIATVPEYVDALLSCAPLGKFTPLESAEFFEKMARDTFEALESLRAIESPGKELKSTITDFHALACLAMYHSKKIPAAVALQLYYTTGDAGQLAVCESHLSAAIQWWEQLILVTQDTYYGSMVTGPNDAGSWRTKLEMVYEDRLRVLELIKLARDNKRPYLGLDFGHEFDKPKHKNEYTFMVNFDNSLERGYKLVSDQTAYTPESGFGWTSHGNLSVCAAPPYRINDTQQDPLRRDCFVKNQAERMKGWRSPLYEDGICGTQDAHLRIDLPQGEFEVTVVICDQTPGARPRGPMSVRIGDTAFADVCAMPLQEKRLRARVRGGQVNIDLSGNWFVSAVLVHEISPTICHVPRRIIKDGAPIVIEATISSPDGISEAALHVDTDGGTRAIAMQRAGDQFFATLPENARGYAIEARSQTGHESRSEDVAVAQVTGNARIRVEHQPIAVARTGADVPVTISVDSARPVAKATLHYSYLNQFKPVESVEMLPSGDGYSANIPGAWLDNQWQVLYYFEVVDCGGDGVIHPDFREETPYYVMRVEE